jgi:bacteriocin-like protein
MKNQDSTEKDVKITTGSQDVARSKSDTATAKELTDEQLAAVVGGIQGAHIGSAAMIKK